MENEGGYYEGFTSLPRHWFVSGLPALAVLGVRARHISEAAGPTVGGVRTWNATRTSVAERLSGALLQYQRGQVQQPIFLFLDARCAAQTLEPFLFAEYAR